MSQINEKEILLKKLLYRSIHRGCKETDMLIGEFAKAKISELEKYNLKIYQDFIQENDIEIYDWLFGRFAFPEKYQNLIQDIRLFHKIKINS